MVLKKKKEKKISNTWAPVSWFVVRYDVMTTLRHNIIACLVNRCFKSYHAQNIALKLLLAEGMT